MVIDMAGAVMNLPAAAYGETSDVVLFLETEYHDDEKSLTGHFFLIPDPESYQNLLEKMGMA
jgi:chemotaxis protein CheC